MSTKRVFAGVPDVIAKMAAAAPGAPTAEQAAEATPAPRRFPVKASTKAMSVNMPKDVYDQLRDFWRMTDIAMTEVIVQGTIKELERLKKLHHIE